MPELEIESPEWWLVRLSKALRDRAQTIKKFNDYYVGDHPLAFATEKFRTAFGGLFSELADNWCGLVVDAVEERLNVRGFRIPQSEDEADETTAGDRDAWRIWQENQLDLYSQIGHAESLIGTQAYGLVWANEDDPDEGTPQITVEHPSQVIVANVPGSRKRAAALKQWRDDWTGRAMATLYLPDGLYKFQSTTKRSVATGAGVKWERREVEGEEWPLENPLELVPVVPLPNRPRLLDDPVSEIAQVIPQQDAVNKTLADMLVASEFLAMPRRWATGIEIPRDPKTGKLLEDETFDRAVDRLWWTKNKEAHFGSFNEAELRNFVSEIEMLVQHIASQTRTPPHYFYLSGQFPSGESIKSAETGLVAKTTRKMTPYGEAWEEIIRIAFAVLDDDRAKVRNGETIWADPESRSESEHIDAILKKQALHVPTEQLWEDAGYSPTQIQRMKDMRAAESLEVAAAFEPFPKPSANGGPPVPAGAQGGAGAGAGS